MAATRATSACRLRRWTGGEDGEVDDDDEASASPRGDADAVTVRRHAPRGETVAAAVERAVVGIALMLYAVALMVLSKTSSMSENMF